MAEISEVLDFLRARFARQDERFDRVERKLDELLPVWPRSNAMSLHGDFAALKVDFASMQSRLDSMDRRLERVVRRLELVEVP